MAVIIPTKNESNQIEAAIASARAEGVAIVVVDGGSEDDTLAKARRAGAFAVSSAAGRARQLAAGVEAVREGEVLIFLHADTRLPRGYVEAVRDALGNARVVGGAFSFRFDDPDRKRVLLRLVEWGARLRSRLLALPYGDQALFIRRSVLDALGGVPLVPVMEDVDLVRGMKTLGKLALLPLEVRTSPRRYLERGGLRTVWRNQLLLLGALLGVDRGRLAAWAKR